MPIGANQRECQTIRLGVHETEKVLALISGGEITSVEGACSRRSVRTCDDVKRKEMLKRVTGGEVRLSALATSSHGQGARPHV